ncbi:MAG: DinB family protein [Flavobacteriaceae bacterium]
MINAIEKNLERGIKLINSISNQQYSDTSIAPYYSSIGGHMRHILDIFDCLFEGLPNGLVDLSARKRNELVEVDTEEGVRYFNTVISKLQQLKTVDLDQLILVSDDLGLGVVNQKYTLGGILIQAHSHAIHHFASLGYIIAQLGIEIPDEDFGYNPTTPKGQLLQS